MKCTRLTTCAVPLLLLLSAFSASTPAADKPSSPPQPLATAVDAVGMTVSDMDRALDFYSRVLSFEKVSDVEVWGDEYEHLEGLFGLRMRVVRMRLGNESIELTQYLAPSGRPVPADSRSNDRWFQHVAIIVSDMDRAYQVLRRTRCSTHPRVLSCCPRGTRMRAGSVRSTSRIPTATTWKYFIFPRTKATRSGRSQTANFF